MRIVLVLLIMVLLSTITFAQAPWDFLRPVTELAMSLEQAISFIVLIVSLAISAIAFMAWRKKKSTRLGLVCLGFFLFFLKLLFSFIDLYFSPGRFMTNAILSVFDLAILLSLFIALFRK